MADIPGMSAQPTACPKQHCGIHRGIVKFEPTWQQGRAHMSAHRMIATHYGGVHPVHCAQYPRVLFEMTLGRRKCMLFHQMLLRSENPFHAVEQSHITCANLVAFTIA